MTAPYTELEKPLDEYAMICRGCLAASGEMKNIFEWGLNEDFSSCTNILVERSDGLSELLCRVCEEMLMQTKRFRAQCQSADCLLRNNVKKKQHAEVAKQNQAQENTISCLLHENKLIIMITAPNMNSKIYLSCPYCQESYIKQKDLMAHLVKKHQVNGKDFSIQLQYYCSVETCSYYINSGKNNYFQGRKYLHQHYIKVHMAKKIKCSECSKTFPTDQQFKGHFKSCNVTYMCQICNVTYDKNEKLVVHLMRKHPDIHRQYKNEKRSLKRKSCTVTDTKKSRIDDKFPEFIDSPKRSFATQTVSENYVKNDVSLPSWYVKSDNFETKTDEISTQTVFEDLLSLKSQNSEDESSIFFSETVSLSDIQTQTFPIEFGLSRSNKETLTSETQSPDLSMKETQTCFCLYDSPKPNYRLFDSVSSSPCSLNQLNLTSAETQTYERTTVKSDVMLGYNSAETQTSFEEKKDSF